MLPLAKPADDVLHDDDRAIEHHGRANDRLLAVERGRTGPELRSGLDVGHVFDEERCDTRPEFQWQVGNVLRIVDATDDADGELLSAPADNAATCILNVLR